MSEASPMLNSSSLAFIEELYLEFLKDPSAVSDSWRSYFEALPRNGLVGRDSLNPAFAPHSLFNPPGLSGDAVAEAGSDAAEFQHRVDKLVRNYRVRGHRIADLNPLGYEPADIPSSTPAITVSARPTWSSRCTRTTCRVPTPSAR